MASVLEQPVSQRSSLLRQLRSQLGERQLGQLRDAADRLADYLDGRPLWHVNSTSQGGGVAELLHSSLPLYRELGLPVRWAVIDGTREFFAVTKLLGLALYGQSSGTLLDAPAQRVYTNHGRALADELSRSCRGAGAIVLHDHQTASMAPGLVECASVLLWRCHVGSETPTPASQAGWSFLHDHLRDVDRKIFSVPSLVPPDLSRAEVEVIPPFIDPTSEKNRRLGDEELKVAMGRLRKGSHLTPGFAWRRPLALQVSRWDRLKDMHGLVRDFADTDADGSLLVVGPDPESVPDDPDQPRWFDECLRVWQRLSSRQQSRIALMRLPMDDLDANARNVNALQRSADVIVQRSLAEGFGLTVTEAMWKGKPVVASAVGGLAAQVVDESTGLLVRNGHSMGPAIMRLFSAPSLRAVWGAAGRQIVQERYLVDADIRAMAGLMERAK